MTMETMLTRPEKASLRQKCGDEESQIHAVDQVTESGATSTSETPISEPTVNTVDTAPAPVPGVDAKEPAVSDPASTQASQEQEQEQEQGSRPKSTSLYNITVHLLSVWQLGIAKANQILEGQREQQDLSQEFDESKFQSCMFLTTGNKPGNQRMVVVPVNRGFGSGPGERRKDKLEPENGTEPEHEDEDKIYERMNAIWREHLVGWLKYAPCYVIIDIRETNFDFDRIPHRGDKVFRVLSTPLTEEQIKSRKEREEAIEDRKHAFVHPESGLVPADFAEDMPAFLDECDEAGKNFKCIRELHHFKEFFQDPSKAVGGITLDGMAQETCLYRSRKISLPKLNELPEYDGYLRGLHITMGWDFELTQTRLSAVIAALVCLILLVRFVSGDWNLALQSGSVLATVAFGAPLAQFFVQDRERPW